MNDFLSQLSMKVTNGSTEIYNASPDQTAGLTNPVFLGKLTSGQTITLTAVLTVPIDLNNDYANRAGEVDWVFTVEKYDDASIDVALTVLNEPENGTAFRPGEQVQYQITVTNDGTEDLINVVVKDELLGIEVTIPELKAGESKVIGSKVDGEDVNYIPHTVTQAEAEAGSIVNTATATGYSKDPDAAPVSDTATVTVNTETVPEYTITVNYLSTTGATLYPSSVQTMAEGSSYNVSSLTGVDIPGYTRTGIEGTVSGTLTGNVVINVRYAVAETDEPDPPTPTPPVVDPVYYTITVRYLDADGNAVLPSTRLSIQSGTAYDMTSYTSAQVDGYKLTGVTGPVSGTAYGNVTIIVRYEAEPAEVIIVDPDPPLGGPAWALLNLICTILTWIIAIFMIISYFKKKEEDEVEELEKALEKAKAAHEKAVASGDQNQILRTLSVVDRIQKALDEAKRRALLKAQKKAKDEGRRPPETYDEIEEEDERKKSKFTGIIPAVVAVIVFILTEDMRLPMVWTDRWTIWMIIILLVNAVLAYLTRNKKDDDEEEDEEEDKNKPATEPAK